MNRRRVKLLEARALSPSVRELTFGAVDGQPLPYAAGQFWNFFLPAGASESEALKRSYSMCAAPAPAQDTLQIAVTRVRDGLASAQLHAMEVGHELEADGPHGLFMAPAADVPILFVAAGTGLAPLRAMLQERLRRQQTAPLTLLFGCRTPADVLWRDELEGWAREHSRFGLELTLSRPTGEWAGRRGYVQAHVQELVQAWPGARPQVFICGLSALVREVRAVLKQQLSYERRAIHSERYD